MAVPASLKELYVRVMYKDVANLSAITAKAKKVGTTWQGSIGGQAPGEVIFPGESLQSPWYEIIGKAVESASISEAGGTINLKATYLGDGYYLPNPQVGQKKQFPAKVEIEWAKTGEKIEQTMAFFRRDDQGGWELLQKTTDDVTTKKDSSIGSFTYS